MQAYISRTGYRKETNVKNYMVNEFDNLLILLLRGQKIVRSVLENNVIK